MIIYNILFFAFWGESIDRTPPQKKKLIKNSS